MLPGACNCFRSLRFCNATSVLQRYKCHNDQANPVINIMANGRFRFTITEKYSEPDKLAAHKRKFHDSLVQSFDLAPYYIFDFDPNMHHEGVSRFWVEGVIDPIFDRDGFEILLREIQIAIGEMPFWATLDSDLPCDSFSLVDKDIESKGYGFGIFTTPFDFQFTHKTPAHPDHHKRIMMPPFLNNKKQQVFRVNFHHDKNLFQLRMIASKQKFKYEFIIELPYDAIKSINFDIVRYSPNHNVAEIQIEYEHPPSLITYGLNQNGERTIRQQHFTWPDGKFSIENFMPEMVNSTAMPVFVKITKSSFYNLIMMLKKRLQCPITFHRAWPAKYNLIDTELSKTEFPSHWPFEVRYLIDCILSRGIVGQKYLLRTRNQFNKICAEIDRLISPISNQKAIEYLMNIYFDMVRNNEPLADAEAASNVRSRYISDNFIYIRKAVITPTRVLYYPPEPIMGSRAVRHFGVDNFLRVVIRSDSMNQLFNTVGVRTLDHTLEPLRDGLTVGGQKFYFIASSSSQLRDHGCYFYRTDDVGEIGKMYVEMGTFKHEEGAAKTMARLGQCFTQSIPSRRKLLKGNFGEIPDYSNSARNKNGESYCFSDGVGVMSMAKALELKAELNLQWTPSCFQIRYAGYKGVLSVDPFLSDYAAFVCSNNIRTDETSDIWMKDVVFRPSQNKFTANEEDTSFEIVKYSKPSGVCLNNQLISIYDQVSEKQSYQSHKRITDRILQLTDANIVGFTNLLTEPFLRRMVLAKAQLNLIQMREKSRIQIPTNYGRNMFGIVDETGFLQYGQVFVQYSDSCDEKFIKNAKKSILEGNVMITKNPMLNMGDLRKFEAINIPALWHLCDVVVFSQHGPRPSPDEMAGSDLDGDEYCVIWDKDLMLDYNEPATDYSASKEKPPPADIDIFREQSIEIIKNYILNDGIGRVSNAHLANSDLYGLESNVCERISKKQITAVDFQKSGIAMKPLTTQWMGPEPPEQAQIKPDFMQKNHDPSYQSNRLVGRVYRKIQTFVDSVSKYVANSNDQPIIDEKVHVDGWESCQAEAKAIYARYSEEIKRIMTVYSVKSEAELFSQCFTDAKNLKQQTNESNSFSSFTTGVTIQKQLYEVWSQFRLEFYAGAKINFEDALANGKKEFLQKRFPNVLNEPGLGLKLRQMAVAYYRVAYENGDIISFPWMVWDVIDTVRYENNATYDPDPLGNHISMEIRKKMNGYSNAIEKSKVTDQFNTLIQSILAKLPGVYLYAKQYIGLRTLIYFLCQWKEEHAILENVSTNEIVVMFMKYAIGQFFNVPGILEYIDGRQILPQMTQKIDLRKRSGGLGRILLTFFIELSRDSFFERIENWLTWPTFGGVDFGDDFCDLKKWKAVQSAARDAYFTTVFQSSSSLLSSDANRSHVQRPIPVDIGEYFTIDVLASFHQHLDDKLTQALCDLSGCTYIAMNVPELTKYIKDRPDFRLRVTLMPKGTPDAICRLRSLLTISAPVSRNDNPADIMYLMKLNMTNQLKNLFKMAQAAVPVPVNW